MSINALENFFQTHDLPFDISGEMPKDASARTYYRISNPKNMIVMDAPLVNGQVEEFVLIANHLKAMGLNAPDIYKQDLDNNFLLLEDFGDDRFSRLIAKGEDRETLYRLAVDSLVKIHTHEDNVNIELPLYNEQELVRETLLLPNWYYPAKTGEMPTDIFRQEWVQAWVQIIKSLPAINHTLVMRDYHCDNLMFVPAYEGVQKCGLLDFQSAVIGPAPYDLVSILENDRLAVPEDIQERMVDYYCEQAKVEDRVAFMKWYRFLSAQRQSKVLGIFHRLYIRDHKPSYMAFIPQVIKLLNHSFKDPLFAPVVDVIEKYIGELIVLKDFDVEALRQMDLSDTLPLK